METADTVIAVLSNHQAAKEAVKELADSGFEMRSPASRPVLSRTAPVASRSRQVSYRNDGHWPSESGYGYGYPMFGANGYEHPMSGGRVATQRGYRRLKRPTTGHVRRRVIRSVAPGCPSSPYGVLCGH